MAVKSTKKLSMLLITVCMAMLVPTGLAQPSPQPSAIPISGQLSSQKDALQCFSFLTDIEGCLMEILSLPFKGPIGAFGPACCKAVTEITDNCWPKFFPLNPFFPPLLKSSCAPSGPSAPALNGMENIVAAKFLFPGLLPQPGGLTPLLPGNDVLQCWSSLKNIPGCVLEVFGSVSTGQISIIGPACCKAVNEINDKCWPKMFPVNPFLPPFIRLACSSFGGTAPSPIGMGMRSVSKFQLPGLLPLQPGTDIAQCWSSLTNIQGCVTEILGSLPILPSVQIGIIGPACCKAITEINDNCWPKMFPFNPFFPPLLKSFCPQSRGATPPLK